MRFDEYFFKTSLVDCSIIGTFPTISAFQIDSRQIKQGDFFIALDGARVDGHKFITEVAKKGAVGALVADEKKEWCMSELAKHNLVNFCLIVVADPMHALLTLATDWRKQFSFPVIGITGSIGKTSTKEMIANLFEKAGKKYISSHGNQNTKLGAALNILKVRSHHEIGVFEMAVSRRGEMSAIARIVQPTIGIITGLAHCHMEGLGSIADIAIEKRDIFKYFRPEDIGIINGDQPLLANVSFSHPVIKFGRKTTNQVQARKVRIVGDQVRSVLKIYKRKYEVCLPKPHESIINNALVTATVGHILHIPDETILEAIQEPITVPGRFEKRHFKAGQNSFINDCYNANPESMKAALLAFQKIETSAQKVAVIGDMLELGINSPFWHRQIGRFLRKVPSLKKVILVGKMVEWTEKTLPMEVQAIHVENWQEAQKVLPEFLGKQDSVVLVKGSLGMGLLNLVDHFAK